jgi:hypothetical protein
MPCSYDHIILVHAILELVTLDNGISRVADPPISIDPVQDVVGVYSALEVVLGGGIDGCRSGRCQRRVDFRHIFFLFLVLFSVSFFLLLLLSSFLFLIQVTEKRREKEVDRLLPVESTAQEP